MSSSLVLSVRRYSGRVPGLHVLPVACSVYVGVVIPLHRQRM